MTHHASLSELALSRFWADGRLPADMRTVDGRRLHVVYPGVWSNSNGPDFRGAMVDFGGGRLVRGDVELHVRASDWDRHGHAANPSYNDVILHVVQVDDTNGRVTRGDGVAVPTLVLQGHIPGFRGQGAEALPALFARLGRTACLPTLGSQQPDLIRKVLREEGWRRLVDKQLAFSQALTISTASEVLYGGLLDALGYSANRKGMASVGAAVPLTLLETLIDNDRASAVPALLLGAAGFLPLSPALTEICRVSPSLGREMERDFADLAEEYCIQPVPPGIWTLNRVRPHNHPAARLSAMAWLVQRSAPEGLLASFLALPRDDAGAWKRWLSAPVPPIGDSRRRQIITNVLAPFMAAYADVLRDDDLAEEIADLWERLPGAVDDQIARQARRQIVGTIRFPIPTALEEQGLHQIARTRCRELRCFDCPIAALAVTYEPLPRATEQGPDSR